jgi:hypothetical protein
VFQDLPEASNSLAKMIENKEWRSQRMDAIHGKRIQLLGFDTCRRMALEFMKSVARESRGKSASPDAALEHLDLPLRPLANGIFAGDRRRREANAQETRARMLRSLDLHLAAKQRDYTAKLMRSAI